jgi:hypothetical protein
MSIALAACASEPRLIENADEIAAHRVLFDPIVRGADACVDEIRRDPNIGYILTSDVTLDVDRLGHARVVLATGPWRRFTEVVVVECQSQIQESIARWRYRAFEGGDLHSPTRIRERVLLLPAERWRTLRRPFPRITDPSDVTITLRRERGFYQFCEDSRSEDYTLQIRGDGDVRFTERVRRSNESGTVMVDAPVRGYSIDPAIVTQLVNQFRAAHFFSLEEEYVSGILHQSAQVLTFQVANEEARVADYVGETVGMPLVVRDLQNAVDAAAGLAPLPCGPDSAMRRVLEN